MRIVYVLKTTRKKEESNIVNYKRGRSKRRKKDAKRVRAMKNREAIENDKKRV